MAWPSWQKSGAGKASSSWSSWGSGKGEQSVTPEGGQQSWRPKLVVPSWSQQGAGAQPKPQFNPMQPKLLIGGMKPPQADASQKAWSWQGPPALTAQRATAEKQKKEAEEKLKAKEATDQEAFAELLPQLQSSVTTVEAAVDETESSASLLITGAPPDEGERTKAIQDVEAQAADVQHRITEVRTTLVAKTAAARQYAPKVQKNALSELNQLLQKITKAQAKLGPYKTFSKEFAARMAARKALTAISDQLIGAEIEIEKATGMFPDGGAQMPEKNIVAAEGVLGMAFTELNDATKEIVKESRNANAAAKAEIEALKSRVSVLRGQLEAANTKMKGQREGLSLQAGIVEAKKKVDRAGELHAKCQEAELPFLKGVEVLPKEEAEEAIELSEKAASEAMVAINAAKMFLRSRLLEAKRFVKDVSQRMTEELAPLQERLDFLEEKLANFKKETSERKMEALLTEPLEVLTRVEKQVAVLHEAAKFFAGDLEEASVDSIRAAIEKCNTFEKEAAAGINEARNIVNSKAKEAKSLGIASSLDKLQARVKAAQETMLKQKQAVLAGAKLIKTKEITTRETQKLDETESELDKAEEAAEGETMSEESVKTLDAAVANAEKTLQSMASTIKPLLASAPESMKETLQKLLDRRTSAQERLDKVKSGTKDQREEVLSGVFQKEAKDMTAAVEACVEKMNEAEAPYLKGVEVLSLQEANAAIDLSEKTSATMQEAIAAARNYVTAKSNVAKAFGEERAKPVAEVFAEMMERITAASTKLTAFRKSTLNRKKAAQIQEAGVKVDEAEAEAKKTLEAADPFLKEDADTLSEEEAAEPLENLLAVEKAAKAKIAEVKNFVSERQRASKDNAEHAEVVKKLQARLVVVQGEMTKARKAAGEHEQRFLMKRLVSEATEKCATLEDEIKKATEACAPLLEEGGETYLVIASMKVLAGALSEHMQDKDLELAELFKEAGGGKKIKQDKFLKYLKDLPDKIGHEELAFTDDRRLAIFKRMDVDKDGFISADEFSGLFRQKCTCKKGISITDGFAIAESKTVGKIEPGDDVELLGIAKVDDAGMLRSECKLKSNKSAWVTVKGNGGTVYVDPISYFSAFCTSMDKAIAEATTSVNQVSGFLTTKLKELGGNSSAVASAKTDLNKLKQDVSSALSSIDALKKRVVTGKREFAQKEKAERNAHIEARDRKAADELLGDAGDTIEQTEAAAKAVEEAGEPFASLEDKEVATFAKPAALLEEMEKKFDDVLKKADASRKAVKEQFHEVAKVTPPTRPSAMAKTDLQKMQKRAEASLATAKKVLETVRARCDAIVDACYSLIAKALRDELQRSKVSVDKLFDDLAKKKEVLPEASFCKKVASLKGLAVKPDHAKLLCRRIGTNGISRRRFLAMVQVYYSPVKDIALTSVFDVNTTKTLRKLEKDQGEILEVLEGPTKDENLGLLRVRARALIDDVEGWVTVEGNQGTPFLKEVEKPLYCCGKEVPLQKEFSGEETVRTITEADVLELLEGPRKEEFPDVLRARVRACKEGVTGWITFKDKHGVSPVERANKLYICRASVAILDGRDIKASKVTRKLAVGELFEAIGDVIEDEESSVSRVEGKVRKDGTEGWITLKGNAGTTFCEAASNYYVVTKELDVHRRFASANAEVVRSLEEGDNIEVLEGPREEKVEPVARIKVRALSDKAVGWLPLAEKDVKAWTASFKCLEETPVHEARNADSEVIRELNKGETFEAFDVPVVEGKELRIRGRAGKDGIVGWVTLKDEKGKRRFAC